MFSAGWGGLLILFLFTLISRQRVDGATFTPGNVVVLIPQGSTSSATAIALAEYSPVGTLAQTVSVAGVCTISGSATSEGRLALSPDGTRVSWGCYACAVGTVAVTTVSARLPGGWHGSRLLTPRSPLLLHPLQQTTAASCPRAAAYVDPAGTVSAVASFGTTAYSGSNMRAAVIINDAGDYITAGATSPPYVGYAPAAGGSATALLSAAANPRCVVVFNSTLFYSTAAAPAGVYMVGAAGVISTAGSQAATAVTGGSGSYPNNSPSSFVFGSPSVLWVCDDGASTSYGVWKLGGTFGASASFVGESAEGSASLESLEACPFPDVAASTGAADRPYSAATCTAITGQVESSVFVLYFTS